MMLCLRYHWQTLSFQMKNLSYLDRLSCISGTCKVQVILIFDDSKRFHSSISFLDKVVNRFPLITLRSGNSEKG